MKIDTLAGQSPGTTIFDYKVTPIYQKDELIPWDKLNCSMWELMKMANSLEIKLGGSKEKVDQYSVTHVI